MITRFARSELEHIQRSIRILTKDAFEPISWAAGSPKMSIQRTDTLDSQDDHEALPTGNVQEAIYTCKFPGCTRQYASTDGTRADADLIKMLVSH